MMMIRKLRLKLTFAMRRNSDVFISINYRPSDENDGCTKGRKCEQQTKVDDLPDTAIAEKDTKIPSQTLVCCCVRANRKIDSTHLASTYVVSFNFEYLLLAAVFLIVCMFRRNTKPDPLLASIIRSFDASKFSCNSQGLSSL